MVGDAILLGTFQLRKPYCYKEESFTPSVIMSLVQFHRATLQTSKNKSMM